MMDMWKRSPSPQESWSDAEGGNENGEWPIKGIVGEEVDPDGTLKYEVDGGTGRERMAQTRLGNPIYQIALIWSTAGKGTQRRKRNALAQDSLDMEVAWPDDAVHKRFTSLRAQAYEEKKKRERPGDLSAADWDKEIEACLQKHG
ncbi:uncharacterized protein EDB91DRAFT_29956 [Suillus paluster]|uniref:uncharacterized protein n=1 Tax=Suillus paluster TaxID=48578 RepID=UPI001B879C78|nr:uncharacterized protein EDB91DRAFT_29956 [Suillus paluster]KAG1756671.1 hypothetical protein EDB91DRAFT_29956 [Suillus paluster]